MGARWPVEAWHIPVVLYLAQLKYRVFLACLLLRDRAGP